jgi:Cellulase (glycosyl hydrolase family 5)
LSGKPSEQAKTLFGMIRTEKSTKDTLDVLQIVTIPAFARRFTINIMNEWGTHDISAKEYAEAYNDEISSVREVYSGPLIIDLPGSAQQISVATDAAKGIGTDKIADQNIILSMHIYRDALLKPRAGSADKSWRPPANADLAELASTGRPCIVGEFGSGNPTKKADWEKLVGHAKALGWPVLGWAWNGDGGSMNMCAPSWAADPQKPLDVCPAFGKYTRAPYYEKIDRFL